MRGSRRSGECLLILRFLCAPKPPRWRACSDGRAQSYVTGYFWRSGVEYARGLGMSKPLQQRRDALMPRTGIVTNHTCLMELRPSVVRKSGRGLKHLYCGGEISYTISYLRPFLAGRQDSGTKDSQTVVPIPQIPQCCLSIWLRL